jgi:dolichol-phosphate mannosyltransferase
MVNELYPSSSALSALVVVPTFDERDNIDQLLRRTRAAVPQADILVVDDGSPDGTAELAESLSVELGRISVLHRVDQSGLGSAYRAGFALGLARGYDVIVEMDADLSHDPGALPDLLRAVEHGAELAIGSRYVRGGKTVNWSKRRRAISRAGGLYARVMLGVPARDVTSGFRAYRSDLLRAIDLGSVQASGYGFQIEMVYRATRVGAEITEVPIVFREREAGVSKMSMVIVIEALALVTHWGLRDRLRRTDRSDLRASPQPA